MIDSEMSGSYTYGCTSPVSVKPMRRQKGSTEALERGTVSVAYQSLASAAADVHTAMLSGRVWCRNSFPLTRSGE